MISKPGWLILLAVSSAIFADEPKSEHPRLAVELLKKEDSFFPRRAQDRTVYVLKSPSGIGGAKVIRTSGTWPRQTVLRFQYDDERAFTMLEGFSLRTDQLEIRGQISGSLEKASKEPVPFKLSFWFVNRDGEPKFRHTGGMPAAGTLDATIQRKTSGLEIALPAGCLQESKSLQLDWIDAYRQ